MFRHFAKNWLGKVILLAWIFIALCPAALIVWLIDDHPERHRFLCVIALFLFLPSLPAGLWLGMTNARYMLEENHFFLESVKLTLHDFRLKLVFVPVIGALFLPDEDKTHYDDDDA